MQRIVRHNPHLVAAIVALAAVMLLAHYTDSQFYRSQASRTLPPLSPTHEEAPPIPCREVSYRGFSRDVLSDRIALVTMPYFDSTDTLDAEGYIEPDWGEIPKNRITFACWGLSFDERTGHWAYSCGPFYGPGQNHGQPFLILEQDMALLFAEYGAYAITR